MDRFYQGFDMDRAWDMLSCLSDGWWRTHSLGAMNGYLYHDIIPLPVLVACPQALKDSRLFFQATLDILETSTLH